MMKIAGSGSDSGSISQRHRSADPDPHQNVMDPQHWNISISCGDFVTIGRTEASMQDITVARLQSTRVQTPLSPLF
jgi:hypothetical protein